MVNYLTYKSRQIIIPNSTLAMHCPLDENKCTCRETTFGEKPPPQNQVQMVRLTERNFKKCETNNSKEEEEKSVYPPTLPVIEERIQRPHGNFNPQRKIHKVPRPQKSSDSQFESNSKHTQMADTRLHVPYKPALKNNIHINGRKVLKRYRSSRMHRVKRQEYKKLREMVPALQEKHKVSKVVVIEEAIKYIDELHSALVQRFRSKGLPATFIGRFNPQEIHGGNIKDFIRLILANANPTSLPPSKLENIRALPSFLQKRGRHKKS